MSVERVKAFFEDKGLIYEIKEFDMSTENVERAAQALGVKPALIAKTLAFKTKEGGILIVMKGDARIDNQKFKEQFRTKAKMMSADEVLESTGHPVGGVCPFGLKQELNVFVDVGIRQYEKVYPAAGSRNSCIEISPDEVCGITGARWVDVCK